MAAAKMSVAELEEFLHDEFPQAFRDDDISIESADGETCLLRQRCVPGAPCPARR